MKQYLDLCTKVIQCGTWKTNRTGIDHLGYHGDMCKYDLSKGFPVVTTKSFRLRSCVAEMLGFLRGYDNAADFRKVGTKVWDANANENQQWLNNPNRKGEDDLGRIYGVQARDWTLNDKYPQESDASGIDQLKEVIDKLSKGVDDRRLIVNHWNPGELSQMSLPPCHVLYQFGIENGYLNMCMYQRSCDLPLGIPFNIAGYAWLQTVIAQITGLKLGVFTHFMWDIHIYRNQLELMKGQVLREPRELPTLMVHPEIRTLHDLETWVTPTCFALRRYDPHPAISYPFAV